MAITDVYIANLALAEIGEAQITAFTDKSNINLQNTYESIRDEILTLFPWSFALKRTRLTAGGILNCSTRTISFVNSNPDTITDSGSGFLTAGFEAGDKITVTGSSKNNTTYNIASVSAGTLILESYEEVSAETSINDTDLKLYANPAYNWSYKYLKPSDFLSVYAVNEMTTETADPNWDIEGDYIVTDEIDTNDQINIQYIKRITDPTKFSRLFIRLFVLKLASVLSVTIANDKALKEFLFKQFEKERLDMLQIEASRRKPYDTIKLTSWQER